MIKYYLLSLIFILLSKDRLHQDSLSVNPKGESELVSDTLIHDLITEVIKRNKSRNCEYIYEKTIRASAYLQQDSTSLALSDSFLTSKDITFMYKQAELNSAYLLSSSLLSPFKLLRVDILHAIGKENREAYWKEIKTRVGNQGFCMTSRPLFSVDQSIAYIGHQQVCGGLCGAGGTYLYQKCNGNWALVKQLRAWHM